MYTVFTLLSFQYAFLRALPPFLIITSHSRMCVSECPSGFFRDDKKRCKKCSSLCETCVGSRSDQCTTCRTGFHLNEGSNTCVANCADGFYLDNGKFSFCPRCSVVCAGLTGTWCSQEFPDTWFSFTASWVPALVIFWLSFCLFVCFLNCSKHHFSSSTIKLNSCGDAAANSSHRPTPSKR